VIGLPFNDWGCLGAISQQIAQMVEERDPVLVELATRYPTTDALAEYLRGLPQRDDLGHAKDGPRVDACEPSQRLRIDPGDPNCVVM